MRKTDAYSARVAGLWAYHVTRQKAVLRARIMANPPDRFAVTVTETNRAQWEACDQMIEAGELVLLREDKCPTRRGPPRPDGTRRIRRERRVTLDRFDPLERLAGPARIDTASRPHVMAYEDDERI